MECNSNFRYKFAFSILTFAIATCTVVIYFTSPKWSTLFSETTEIERFPNYRNHLPGAEVLSPFQLHHWYQPAGLNSTLSEPQSPVNHKTVLFWINGKEPLFNQGAELFRGCPESRCYATTKKTRFNESAAVVYVAHDIGKVQEPMPVRHDSNQLFVFMMGESPQTTGLPGGWFQTPRFFNWTMTYRLDSDIRSHYTYKVPLERNPRNFASEKTKLVAWIVSHCPTTSHREDYVKELGKYIPVDIYGRCGNMTCPQNGECFEKLWEYKFYLSFENTMCRDYITEKFTNAFQFETVPIVLGDGNYRIFPPYSFIHTYDFPSPKSLAEYLLRLDKNDAAYNEYMLWRFDPKLTQSHGVFAASRNGFCRLCQMLYETGVTEKSYPSIVNWWQFKGRCRDGMWLLKNTTLV